MATLDTPTLGEVAALMLAIDMAGNGKKVEKESIEKAWAFAAVYCNGIEGVMGPEVEESMQFFLVRWRELGEGFQQLVEERAGAAKAKA